MGRSFHAVDLVDVTYICHEGKKGMHWGQRFYQEPGTNHWTELGKLRYGNGYNNSLYEAAKTMTDEELKAAVNRKRAQDEFIKEYSVQSKTKQKIARFAEKILDTALESAGTKIGSTIGAQLTILADNKLLSKVTSKIEGAEDYVLKERWGKDDWKAQKKAAEDRKAQKELEKSMTKEQRKAHQDQEKKDREAAIKRDEEKRKAEAEKKAAEDEKYTAETKAQAEAARRKTTEAYEKAAEDRRKAEAARVKAATDDLATKYAKQVNLDNIRRTELRQKAAAAEAKKASAEFDRDAKKYGSDFAEFIRTGFSSSLKGSYDQYGKAYEEATGKKLNWW